jgi:hypothetical protein
MRTAPNNLIYNLWNAGGPFIGDAGAPHGRITIQPAWLLRASAAITIGDYDRGPIRYFQNTDNAQTEYELPNVKTIDIDRSIDTPAASLRFVMVNQKMLPNGQILAGTAGEMVGQPGYYWPGYGDSATSQTKWGQTTNIFNNLIQPNALVRVYQGYGGRDKTIDQALTDGNVILTGIFLVDSVSQDAKTGQLTVSCRDMAKLLIEQTLYPPLVPVGKDQSAHYPLNYYRWVYQNHSVVPYSTTVYRTGFTELEGALSNAHASSHFDNGTVVHVGGDAIDGTDPSTYWLSAGRLTGTTSVDYEYLQFDVSNKTLGGLNIQPFAGNYVMYISVRVSGVWQDPLGKSIPYTGTNGGVAIPYVNKVGVGWERAATIDFGQDYANVDLVRVTFTHLAKVAPGPLYYACGIRDFQVGTFTNSVTGGGRIITGIARGHNASSTNGYWIAGTDGGVFTFGDLKFYGSEGNKILNGQIVGIASNPVTGAGYRLVGADGGVFDFGDLYYKGSLPGLGIAVTNVIDIENGDQGHSGYYILRDTGEVYSFGTAVYHGNHSGGSVAGMAVKANGYWTVDIAGSVQAHGAATNYGSWSGTPGGLITGIESTSTGNGYWLVDAIGEVQAFGDATHAYGGLPGAGITLGAGQLITDMARTGTDNGYWLVGEDGGVFAFGDAQFSGSLPEQYSRVGNGNYEDYIDIIKDLLLWSGWWFHNPALGDSTPANVFGNLESTGIYAPDNLTEDFFDKKPVIDVINTIKEIVGYISYADEIGSWQFKTPNVWSIGNFLDTGIPTSRMPVVDESKQIIEYQVGVNDTDARTQIIIGTDDPALGISDTKSVTFTSQWAPDVLRGLIRPALWVNGQFLTTEIQRTMAELIDLHLFMQQRQGSLTMPANPILQIDDQVRVYERNSSDVYIHYVRGYSTHMDLESGEFTQTLQLHWMGDGNAFFLQYGT